MKKRNYGGARGGRLFGDFVGSSFSADSELRYNLEVLRNRSRELVRDNEFAKRYINLIKTNIPNIIVIKSSTIKTAIDMPTASWDEVKNSANIIPTSAAVKTKKLNSFLYPRLSIIWTPNILLIVMINGKKAIISKSNTDF